MVVSRCLGALALFVAGADGARIARKRGSSNVSVAVQDCYSMYDGQTLLRLRPCTSAEARGVLSHLEQVGCKLIDNEFRLFKEGCDENEVVCSAETASALVEKEIATIVSSDAGAHWRKTSGGTRSFSEGVEMASDFYSTWRDLDALMAHVASLVDASGGVATLETAGQSLQGRDIKIVRFRGKGYSSGGTRLVASFNLHAREWITGMSGVYAVEQLIAKVQQDPDYLAGTEVVFMPMANPDGFQYSTTTNRMHRKNMAGPSSRGCYGVDNNRNFDAHWNQGGSSNDPCSDVYHGPAPMSEPESRVLAKVMEESPMTVFIDVHSYTQLIISSYGWTTADHPRQAEYRELGKRVQTAIRETGGNTWTEGAAAQTLYAASGGTIDYADDRGALGVCFELRPPRYGGGGFSPPTSQILPAAEECFAGLVVAIDYAKNPPPPPAPTPAPPPGSWVITGNGCEAVGDCAQSSNHPANYGNNAKCQIELYGDISIQVESFETERSYDRLTIGGRSYSGTSGPSDGVYTGTISWSSDYSVAKRGWKLCKN